MNRVGALRAAVLVAAIAGVYANSLEGRFHYDDFHSLVRNAAVRDLGNLPRFLVDPALFSGDADKGMYRPVLLATYAVDYALHGYDVTGYHIVNILLHLACAALVWQLAAAVAGPSAGWPAALLFGVHPLASEPVNYISSRSELLLALFFLGALVAHRQATARSSRHLRWVAVSSCALALLSKATAVALAPALLVFDVVVPLRPCSEGPSGVPPGLARRHAPYWLLTGLYLCLITANGFLVRSLQAPVRDAATQALTQLKAPAFYARLLAIPRPLSVDHAFAESATWSPAVLAGSLLAMSVIALLVAGRGWRRLPGPVFAAAVAVLVLLPTSLMPLNVLVNERRLYLVLAAGSVLLVAVARLRPAALAAAGLLLAGLTMQRNPVWASPTRLWEEALHSGSRSYRAWANLGKALQEEGRPQEALDAYRRALAIDDRYGDAYNNIAVILHQSGRPEEALAWYEKAVALEPDMDEVYQNLADAYAQLGQGERAAEVYRKALGLDESNGGLWNNYGEYLMKARRWTEAEAAFRRAGTLLGDQHEPRNNLGNALSAQGRQAEAVEAYRQALAGAAEPEPRSAVLANLGESLRVLGRLGEAAATLDSAIALSASARALDYRGRLALDLGRGAEAALWWERCVAVEPGRATAWVGLGELHFQAGRMAAAEEALRRAVGAGGGARAWLGLARCLDVAGNGAEAIAAYRRAVEGGGANDPRLAEARRRLQVLEASS